MRTRQKRVIACIMAILMAFTLLPFNTWETANVVMAEESETANVVMSEENETATDTWGGFSPESLAVEEETNEDTTSSAAEEETETSAPAQEETETSAPAQETEKADDEDGEEETDVKEETREEEKDSAETDNKATVNHIHNFTGADGNYNGTDANNYFTIMGNKKSGPKEITYNGLTLTAALKMEGETKTKITFTAENVGILTLVHCTDTEGRTAKMKVDGQAYTTTDGVTIVENLSAGEHTITKGETTNLYYISFVTEEAPAKEQVSEPTAASDSGELKTGDKITLSCDTADATIYYTTDGSDPKDNASKNTYTDADKITITSDMVIDNKITIKAYASKAGCTDSNTAEFTYTVFGESGEGQPKIEIDTNSAALIESVKLNGDVRFTDNSGNEALNVLLKAEKNAAPSNDIQAAAETLKKGEGTILYYDFSLVNADNPTETVKLAEGVSGKLKIKMPYSIVTSAANKRNGIIVLHGTENKLEVTKETDGFSFLADSFSPYTVIVNPAPAVQAITIKESAGYEEGAYAEWEAVDGADGYMAYVASAGGEFKRIDDQLIRQYDTYWRVDTVGLAKGTYYIKVNAVALETDGENETATVIATKTTDALKVTNYDRSGFAFSEKSPFKTGSGAYNEDGTLRDGAKVIYVTAETAKTVTLEVQVDAKGKTETRTGIQNIIQAKEKGADKTPWAIRIIGCVTDSDLDSMGSSAEGLQIKGKSCSEMNITIEGIGEDAVIKGFGFLIRECGNVELRNFGILNFMDDGVSMDTNNCNIWVHDLDIFYGKKGSAADQIKGDGSIDVKANSTYVTVSYNHFWDSGKCSLCGMKSDIGNEFMVTYHHNWFDHSDSRHPRIRGGTIHIYNNYFDGNSKYGVGATTGSSAFVEANYFRNCKYPMMMAQQGTDAKGEKSTFSGEDAGVIKAYANHIEGAGSYLPYSSTNTVEFDAYEADAAGIPVPESVTAKNNAKYNNFDTSSSYDIGVTADKIDAAENVPAVVMEKAGRLNGGDFKWTFDNAAEDANAEFIAGLRTAIENYKPAVKTISGGVTGNPTVLEDNGADAPDEEPPEPTQPVIPPEPVKPAKPDGIYIAGLEESYLFTGAKIIPDIEVWYCYQGVETLLSLGVDYTVSYKNNVKLTSETQKAEVIVTGKGNYAGTGNAKTFSIIDAADAAGTLADLKGAKLKEKIAPQDYSKEAILPDFTLMMKDGSEVTYTKNASSIGKYMRADGEKMDVNVAVSNNINKGTATILVTGGKDSKGKTTSFKTAFKIMPIDISRATVEPTAGTYAVNGAAPGSVKVTIQLNGQSVELKNGKDYTVKYSNNKNAGQGKVTVTGKGNYTKKHAPVDYTINKLDLSTLHVDAVTACEGTKAGKVKATIADANGNVIPLKASQYKLAILEYNEPAKTTEASPYDSAAQLEAGKRITVIATAADEANLEKDTATREAEFKVGIDISKAKFKIKKDAVKEYTGNAVTLAGSDFDNPTIKTGGAQVPLVMGKDYEIASYSNNINKGTATAVIKGIGDYSGTKTVKFKITQKPMQITKADPKPWELWNKLLNSLAN